MSFPIATFSRGETITLAAPLFEGSLSDVVGLPTAKLKALAAGAVNVPPEDQAFVATFTVTTMAAQGDIPAGWMITLSDEESEALPVGRYITDLVANLVGGGKWVSRDKVVINLQERVTR